MQRRTTVLSIMGGATAALLLVTSAAFACVSLATLDVTPGKGAPGDTVKVSGRDFNAGTTYSDIEVRWGGSEGPIVATVKPVRNPSFDITVPASATPGTYMLLATQRDPAGAPLWGLPARATFTVVGGAPGVVPAGEAAPAPETITIEQKYVVPVQTPAPAAAPAQATPAQAAASSSAPIALPAPAAQPTQALSLEARDAITEQVTPAGERSVNYVPAASRAESSNNTSLRLGIALAVIGSMALLTAAGAAYLLRPAPAKVQK